MNVTLIGIVVIILSIIAFIKDEDWLLGLVMFFSTFTAAATFSGTSAMTPFKIPLYLWLLKQGINFIKFIPKMNKEVVIKVLKENKIFSALFIFAIAMVISVVWLWISGINYEYYDTSILENATITFSSVNISQLRGILIYLLFLMILSLKIDSKEKIKKLLKIFCISTIFAIIWGFIQFILYYLNIDYPEFLFNNNNNYKQWYEQVMHGIKRISSISAEPSVFSLNLLGFLPIVLIPWLYEKEKNKKIRLAVIIVITIVCAILTTSSTALIGLVVIMSSLLLYLLVNVKKQEDNKKKIFNIIGHSILSIVIAILICITVNIIPTFNIDNEQGTKQEADISETIKEMTISKLSSDSGKERMSREILGFEIYKISPIFGVGFGSFRTYTIFTNILVNVGILGILSYIYILFIVCKTIIANRKKDEKQALIFLLSILGMTLALAISIPDLIYIYYWIVLVFAYKYFMINENETIKNNQERIRIGIDARSLRKEKAGIATYVEEIIKQLNDMADTKNEYILYSNREIYLDIKLKENIQIKSCNKPIGTFWTYFILPKILKQDKIDIFWGPQHLLPKRDEYTENIKYILTVHDLAIHKLGNIGEWKNTLIQKLFLKRSCKNADKIIAISESTKKDIIEIFNIEENKIKVVYSGTNLNIKNDLKEKEQRKILKKFHVEDKNYLFFVSTIEPRKNIITLIKAFEMLKEKNKEGTLKLILAGGLGWKYEGILDTIENSKYKDSINLAGYISKQEKECLLHNTKCFVYPSLYEGFGLPILEAMANEAIVVTSNISAIPEVGGDVAFYFNNVLDSEELESVIEKVLNMSEEDKNKIVKKGIEQTKKFTWDKCVQETLAILNMN